MLSLRFSLLLSLYCTLIITPAYAAPTRDAHMNLYKQARTLEDAGKLEQAIDLYKKSLALSRQDFPEDAAAILHWMGDVYKTQQKFAESEQSYQEALQIREKVLGTEHGAVALTLNNLAGLYFTVGDYAKAEMLFQRALAIDEKDAGKNSPKVAIRLNNLGELYRTLNDFKQAEPLFQRALTIDEKAYGKDHPQVAIRLSNLAEMYRLQGDYVKCETLLQQALSIDEKALRAKELGPANVGIRLNNLGQLYRTLGDYARAEPFYQRAIKIWEKTPGKQHPLYAAGLNNLGWIYQVQEKYAQAEPLYQQALKIVEVVYTKPHPDTARYLNNLALLYTTQGKHQAAEPLYQRALQIWETVYGTNHPSYATTLANLAKIYLETGNYAQAESLLQRALLIAQSADQPELLWSILDILSRVLIKQQQISTAILVSKQAVNTLQRLRVNIAKMDKELQRIFLQEKTDVYRRLADLLMNQGRLSEAQQVLMMLKEEEYFDFVRRDSSGGDPRIIQANFNGLEQTWVERSNEIYAKLTVLGEAIKALRQKPSLTIPEKKQLQELQRQSDVVLQNLAKYFRELKETFAEEEQRLQKARQENQPVLDNLCAAPFDTKRVESGKTLETLKNLQNMLRNLGYSAVLLHYLITPEKLRIILTTPDVQLCRDAVISETELNEKIAKFRSALQNVSRYPIQESRALYEVLFAPIAQDLEKVQAKTIMLALDGKLRYLPIAALYDGKQYVAEQYTLAMFTEAARDTVKELPLTTWTLAGLGLTKAVRHFNPLPSVEVELHGIVRENDKDTQGVLPGIIHLNQDFTAATLQKTLQQAYPVVHIASHFVFQSGTDQNSFLLLGDGNELTLAQVRSGYDFSHIDLLTLSACQTAMGDMANGREIESFGALAQKQGAKSVIATLWPVDDKSTSAFMQYMYRIHTQQKGITKAIALQEAQKSFIVARKATLTGNKSDTLHPAYFDHPYYWAPFVLMGNWL